LIKKSELQLQEQEMQYEDLRSYFVKYHDFVAETIAKLEIAETKVEESDERERNLQK